MDLPPVSGKAPRQLTNRHELLRSPAWTVDGKEILYAAGDVTTNAGIYRLPTSGGEPVRLSGIGSDVEDLTLSRNGKRLVYSRNIRDYNIYRLPTGRTAGGIGGERIWRYGASAGSNHGSGEFSARCALNSWINASAPDANLTQCSHIFGSRVTRTR
jgi:hypothetical protein